MIRWLGILLRTLGSAVRRRRELALENLALRQQLAVWKARQPRPRLTEMDRLFWVVLSKLWKNWRGSLRVVRPETVVRWHRRLSFAKISSHSVDDGPCHRDRAKARPGTLDSESEIARPTAWAATPRPTSEGKGPKVGGGLTRESPAW